MQLQPLVDALREVVLAQRVVTPMKRRMKALTAFNFEQGFVTASLNIHIWAQDQPHLMAIQTFYRTGAELCFRRAETCCVGRDHDLLHQVRPPIIL